MRLPAYAKYKPTGLEWLGDVPEHWEVKRGRFCMEINPRSQRQRALRPDDEVSFVPMEAVGEYGGLNLGLARSIADVESGYTEFDDGDVLVAKITPCFENGKGAFATGLLNKSALGTTELFVLRAFPALDRRFLFYVTISQPFRNTGEGAMYGAAGQKRVPIEFCANFRFQLPSPTEQHAIADYLDRETAKIDMLMSKKRTLIERLREKRTALISRTVTRGLPPDPARAAGLDPHPNLKPYGIAWLRDMPEHWEAKRLRQISDVITVGVVVNPSTYVADVGVPFLMGGDVREFYIDTTKSKRCLADVSNGPLLKSRLAAGDLVVVRVGYPGVAAVVPEDLDGANCASMMIVRRHRRFASQWLAYAFNSQPGRDQIDLVQYGAAQKQFNISHAVDFTFPFPPLSEQYAIAEFLDLKTVKIDSLVETVETAIDRLHEYRASLITAAVTGKIDVRGTTPVSDPPAALPGIVTRAD